MLGGGFSLGMYRKAMSMHIAAGDGCNYCRCDEGKAPMERKEGRTLLRGGAVGGEDDRLRKGLVPRRHATR